ncbi:MAG: hypothetical protein EA401_10245, partial [Planctomycetota bacterium]
AETWLETVATHGGLRGTALGHWTAVAQEATRRGLQWIQSRCRLFRKPASVDREGALRPGATS